MISNGGEDTLVLLLLSDKGYNNPERRVICVHVKNVVTSGKQRKTPQNNALCANVWIGIRRQNEKE